MVENALRGVLRQALKVTEAQGLPGAHHFYITFDTTHPDVQMAESLKALHPNEMTIVVQHQYWDLMVDDEHFEIALSFSGVNQHLSIPFDAVTAFADPHAKFGLQFHVEFEDAEEEEYESDEDDTLSDDTLHVDSSKVSQHLKSNRRTITSSSRGEAPKAENTQDADDDETDNVVALDAFRKK